jgi:hypothetical protein
MPNAIHGAATIMSAPVICHLSSSQGKPPRLEGECALCGGQMETVLHAASIEAAQWLQKTRVRSQG